MAKAGAGGGDGSPGVEGLVRVGLAGSIAAAMLCAGLVAFAQRGAPQLIGVGGTMNAGAR